MLQKNIEFQYQTLIQVNDWKLYPVAYSRGKYIVIIIRKTPKTELQHSHFKFN